MSEKPQQTEQKQPVIWRRRVAVIAVFIFGAAIVGRVMLKDEESTSGGGSGMRSGLVAGDGTERVEQEEDLGDKLAKLLPYVTEAAMALLLGMIVGIGTRMAIKTVVIALVLGVIGVQYAIFKGWLTPEDARFIGHMKDYVFNVPEGKEASEVAMDKAPSFGAGLLGFMMGLKKG